jgi:hypothetical protein
MATRPRPAAPTPTPTPASAIPPKLIPLTEWPHAWPPLGGLRWLAFNAETNGFKNAFLRVGNRVLVDEVEFFRCVERGRAAKPRPIKRRTPTRNLVAVLDAEEGEL